ncbi:putative lipoprotein [Yersinia frederiksenii]|nr:putative lipoprotein [Yersinia frederiksenii]CNI62574.1 putative lipoprotein [Yersinia frederiksenii]
MKSIFAICAVMMALLLTGCAKPVQQQDYSAFKQSKPKSILVLLPQNQSPEVAASHGMLSQVTYPLAEAGYYVLPVAVVEETFKQNGMTNAGDIHAVSPAKLHKIFGADAVLYITVVQYGTSYQVITSDTRVTANAKLVDLRTGKLLWSGSATASSNEGDNSSGGVIDMLVQAAVTQISNTLTDHSHDIAGVTSTRMLTAGTPNGILYGPRSPNYGKDAK